MNSQGLNYQFLRDTAKDMEKIRRSIADLQAAVDEFNDYLGETLVDLGWVQKSRDVEPIPKTWFTSSLRTRVRVIIWLAKMKADDVVPHLPDDQSPHHPQEANLVEAPR